MGDSGFEIDASAYMTLRDVVFKSIRDAILSGSLKAGERLMEKDLAERLGVSRTPIREALRKLEIEGFIEMIPRKGAVVKEVTGKEIGDVLEIRAALEALAAKIACVKMSDETKLKLNEKKEEFVIAAKDNNVDQMAAKDVEFHELIYSATDNEKLIQIINNLREQIYRYRVIYLYDKNYISHIIDEHEEITKAIANGDGALAEELSSNHIYRQQQAILSSLKKEVE
ncbi:GntR family transcriptional regulator [Tyzzerella sp. OttesenSCG-928-J15]|nr:GntR family transcriptional regulator [Tyzzerella sp. OttesenSCG-928-J15]